MNLPISTMSGFISLLLYLGLIVVVCWGLYQLSMWVLMRGRPTTQLMRNEEIEADAAYVKHLITFHELQRKIGNVAGADQIEAELRELRIEGWYRPASTKSTDTSQG